MSRAEVADFLAERRMRRDDMARIGTDPQPARAIRSWDEIALQRALLRQRERKAERRMREAAQSDAFRPRLFWGAALVFALVLAVAGWAGVVIE